MDALERRQYLFWNETGGAKTFVHCFSIFFCTLLLTFPVAAAESPSANLSADVSFIVRHDLLAGKVPGAVVVIGEKGRTVYQQAFGVRSLEPSAPPLRVDNVFDLASLTKVIATTTAVMQLLEQGKLQLDTPAAVYWPAFGANGKDQITVRQLLLHASGLQPDLDLSASWRGTDDTLARVAKLGLLRPPGTAFAYSDINFIALGTIVARVSGEPFDEYVREHVFKPMGMTQTEFRPPPSKRNRIVATERGKTGLRWGEVQDPTAYRMGGVAGHAGLFSTGADLSRFVRMLLEGGRLNGARILKPETVALMTQPELLPSGVRRGLGWDMSSSYSQGLDREFGPASFGHTGYTGCMLWIDPVSKSYLIVLTSRLQNGNGNVEPLRQDLGRLVADASRNPP